VPVVFITAQVTSGLIGTDAFQETDILGISMPVTKWNAQVKKAEEIPDAVARAFYIARTGRPGPVLIDIAKDAQFGSLTYRYSRCTSIRSYNPVNPLISRDIESAAVMINHAERPMILAGHGVIISGAMAELRALAEPFFEVAGDLWDRMSSEMALQALTGLYPSWNISEEGLARADRFLAGELPAGLRRVISEERARVERALRNRAVDRGDRG